MSISPAIVVQPQPSAVATQSYPGEVRARFDPQLAFRIGGKVTKRWVDEGERVKANQSLAELDPQDVRLQLEATRAQVAAAQANLSNDVREVVTRALAETGTPTAGPADAEARTAPTPDTPDEAHA